MPFGGLEADVIVDVDIFLDGRSLIKLIRSQGPGHLQQQAYPETTPGRSARILGFRRCARRALGLPLRKPDR